MNVAAILALLLSSGVCGKSDFHMADGGTLRVVVCPMVEAGDAAPAAPAAPPAGKEERRAMAGQG